jgi:hypothetical protein
MKVKFTLSVLFVALIFTIKAQQIPNGNFESWTINPLQPDGWVTLDGLIGDSLGFSYKDQTDTFLSTTSVKLVSDSVYPEPALGVQSSVLSLGTATYNPSVDTNGPIYFGTPFPFRPDTLFFAYQYTSPGVDTGALFLDFIKDTSLLIGEFYLLPVDTWQYEYAPLDQFYNSSATPDTILIQFLSSGQFNTLPVKGSTLHVDAVSFSYSNATGVEAIVEKLQLQVFPNPASSVVNIQAASNLAGYRLFVTDMTGRAVALQALEGNTNQLDVSRFAAGTYIYHLVDATDKFIMQDKFSVVR